MTRGGDGAVAGVDSEVPVAPARVVRPRTTRGERAGVAVTRNLTAYPYTLPLTEHGEGPTWLPRTKRLAWVDMLEGDLLLLRPDGSIDRQHVGGVAACVRERADGGIIVAIEDAVLELDQLGHTIRVTPLPIDRGISRCNEGTCGPDGNFYIGTMGWNAEPGIGHLYSVTSDGQLSIVFDDLTVSNGIAFFDDGTGRFADSASGQVDRIQPRPGGGLDRHHFVTIGRGSPDGLCLDSAGGTWVALWGGGAVHRYTKDGELDVVVEVPVSQVTACAFGDDDLSTLFITTSRYGLDNPEPLAGAVFAVRPDHEGLTPMQFGLSRNKADMNGAS